MYLGETRVNLPIKLSMMDTVTKGDKMILRKMDIAFPKYSSSEIFIISLSFQASIKRSIVIIFQSFQMYLNLPLANYIIIQLILYLCFKCSHFLTYNFFPNFLYQNCINSQNPIIPLTIHEPLYFNYNSSNSQDSKCLSESPILSNFHSLIHHDPLNILFKYLSNPNFLSSLVHLLPEFFNLPTSQNSKLLKFPISFPTSTRSNNAYHQPDIITQSFLS